MPKVFVYGAQMIHPESAGAGWAARVDDHAVRFVAPGVPVFEPVFAALVPEPGAIAFGVIVDFSDEAWRRLLALETGYELREVIAKPLDPEHARELGSAALPCPAFVGVFDRPRRERRPSARYARKLAAGARAHGLPREIIDRYERAEAEGGRASLALSWLFPIAARIGLVPTAILLVLLALLLVALLAAIVLMTCASKAPESGAEERLMNKLPRGERSEQARSAASAHNGAFTGVKTNPQPLTPPAPRPATMCRCT